MRHRSPSIARAALALAPGLALLGGCAEIHHGAEAVGRLGSSGPPVEQADAVPPARPDVRTVKPRGADGAPASARREPDGISAVAAAAVPSPRQIFDFHPPGARPDSWRQPFVIDTSDGPLAADLRRSTAELKSFMAERKAGNARSAAADATGTARRACSETDVATARPGCAVPPAP